MAGNFLKKLLVSAVISMAAAPTAGAVEFINPLTGTSGGGKTLSGLIDGVINFLFGLALFICPALMVWGGFLIATAAGDENKVGEGRRIITYAAIGLVVIAASGAVKAIILDIVNS